jgi:gas vesicle protein
MKKTVLVWMKGLFVTVVLGSFVVVSGCQKEEGAMEKAGKQADKGIAATIDAVKQTGKKVGESIDATQNAMKQAGEKVGQEAEKTREAVMDAAKQAAENIKK